MTNETARQILLSLLAEKGIAVDGNADIRQVLRLVLDDGDAGTLPEGLCQSLAELFDAVARPTSAL